MPRLDDELQKHLDLLERGIPLDDVLMDIPPAFIELDPLIQLAVTFRETPIPEPKSLPETLRRPLRVPIARTQPPPTSLLKQLKAVLSPPAFRLAGATMAAMLLIVAMLGFGFWLGRSREAQKVALLELSGLVEVASSASAHAWQVVDHGTEIKEGQRIRTGADGAVTLLFFEGSRVTLESDTDLILAEVGGDGVKQLNVTIDQVSGETYHSVVPLQGEESAYRVNTLAGSVSVRGTTFQVSVPQAGQARFAVGLGEVLVTSDDQEMLLSAGEAVVAQADQPLTEPAYQFSIKGILKETNQDIWVVGEVTFQVTPATSLKHNPQVGDYVLVDGRILAGGTWIADRVKVVQDEKVASTFTGTLESTSPDWVVNKVKVGVNAQSHIDDGLEVGDSVQVTFIVLDDGSWLALAIQLLREKTSEFEPAVLEATSSGTTTAPTLDCVGADPQPEAETLAAAYDVSYEEIMGWFCQGYGFGEIGLVYSLSLQYGLPVEEIFALRVSGMGWGEIEALLASGATITPSPTITPMPTPTPTPTPTEVLQIIVEPTLTKVPTPTEELKPTKEPKPTKVPKPTKEPKPTKDSKDTKEP